MRKGWAKGVVAGAFVPVAVACAVAVVFPVLATAGATTTTPAAGNTTIAGLGSVSCPSANVCVAVGATESFPQGPGVVVGTTDGGAHWKVEYEPASNKGEVIFYAIDCPTTKHCEVAGIGPGDDGSVYATTNGGTTWHKQPVQLPSEPFLAVTCSTDRFCLTGGDDPGTPTNPLYVTTDGGTTWTASTVGSALGQIYALACLPGSTTTCFAGGYDGHGATDFGPILRSSDGGTDWTVVADHPKPVSAFSCPTTEECEAAGGFVDKGGSMWGTGDGGSTWTRQHLPGAVDLVGVSCDSADECVAVTAGSQAWVTEDGGSSWSEHTLPSPVLDLRGIACPVPSTCEGVGETAGGAAVAARTTDGGVTWTVQSLPSPAHPPAEPARTGQRRRVDRR